MKYLALLSLLAITIQAQNDCPIGSYTGKGFIGTLNFDNEGLPKLDMLNQLILRCNLTVNVTRSFTRSANPTDSVEDKNFHLFVGRGFNFELLDNKQKLLCDKKCLATKPMPKSPVDCFITKLGDHYSPLNPGVFSFKAFSSKSVEDFELLKSRQVSCQFRNDLPQ